MRSKQHGSRVLASGPPFGSSSCPLNCLSARRAWLSGVVAPKFDEDETTVADLKPRIAWPLDFALSVPADRIDGSHVKVIEVPMCGRSSSTFPGKTCLKHWVSTNFYFHLTTACGMLRHKRGALGPDR